MSNGFVRLVSKLETPAEVAVVNAARQSYGRRVDSISEKDINVLDFMMEHKHGTPFEAAVFQFHIRCTIKEARDWFRYRAGSSFNEYSTRFSPCIQDQYVPTGVAIRTGSASAKNYSLQPIEDPETRKRIVQEFEEAYADADRHYRRLLELGLAQEAASYVYPLGQMTEFTWTVNLRTLCNFWAQRTHETALLELRRKAYSVMNEVYPHAPNILVLWSTHRRPDMYTDWVEGDVWLPEELR